MSYQVDDLLTLLDLEPIEVNIYRGTNRDIGSGRVFGGQVLAQSLVAAQRTVEQERVAHSVHGYFILPGDLAFVRQQPTAENGEIVVARVHQSDATLKRFYRRVNRVVLKAENPKYDPIEVNSDEVEVIGKLIGMYRRFV